MGMGYEDFWHGPAELVKDYRAAENIRRSKANQQMWIQGLYMAHAIAACLDKKAEYPKEPLFIYEHERDAKRERDRQRAITFFNQFAALHKGKGGG
jgi:hypothetical protein